MARFCYLDCYGPENAAAASFTCNFGSGNCDLTPAPNNTACDDGNACTCDTPGSVCITPCGMFCCASASKCPGGADGHCQAGQCVSNHTDANCNTSNCTTVGQKGVCPNDTYCCGGQSCVNINTDARCTRGENRAYCRLERDWRTGSRGREAGRSASRCFLAGYQGLPRSS